MAAIETVRGTVDTADLGRVLMHEHVFVLTPEIMNNYDTGWDEEVRVADAIERLKTLKANGISTIVDLTVVGLGRYIPRIQRVNAEVDINIIAATGLYTYNEIPHYFHFRGPGLLFDQPELLIEMFVKDVEIGIGETGVKAGVFKCATDEPGLRAAWSGCCVRWPRRTAQPGCPSPRTPTPTHAVVSSSRTSSTRRASTPPRSSSVTAATPPISTT